MRDFRHWKTFLPLWLPRGEPVVGLQSRGEVRRMNRRRQAWSLPPMDKWPALKRTGEIPLFGRQPLEAWPGSIPWGIVNESVRGRLR